MINSQKLNGLINYLLPVFLIYFSIFQYKYFGIFILVIFLIKNYLKIEIIDSIFYKYYPLLFYSLKFIFNLSENFNFFHKSSIQLNYYEKARFLDLQNLFLELVCNSGSNFTHIFKFDHNYVLSCPYKNYWGPISTILNLNNINIWISTLLLSCAALIMLAWLYLSEYKKLNKNQFLLFAISISPPVNFLIDRMNIDIFIFLITFILLKNIERNLIFKLITLSIFTLYKLHPLVIFFSIFIYFYLKRQKKESLITLFFAIVNSIIIFNFYSKNDFLTARPYLSYRSFGVLSDATFISKFLNSEIISYLLLILFLIILTNFIYKSLEKKEYELNSIFFNISSWFIGVSMYSNYDYRIPILLFILLQLFRLDIDLLNVSLLIFVFLSPFPISTTYIYLIDSNIFSNNFVDVSLYIILGYLISIQYLTIKTMRKP